VVEDGVVVIRDLGRQVLVDSDVKRGDQVILDPAVDVADGAKVRIRRETIQTS
jgi:hypothetical protein